MVIMVLIFLISCSDQVPEPDLKVEVSFDNFLAGQVIEDARLNCSEIPKYDYNGEIVGYLLPSSPDSWCAVQASNLPLPIDDSSVELYFHISPSPLTIEFEPEPSPAYDSPMLYLKINGESYVIGMENNEQNLWKTIITLR